VIYQKLGDNNHSVPAYSKAKIHLLNVLILDDIYVFPNQISSE
jgi:hypothetical protein